MIDGESEASRPHLDARPRCALVRPHRAGKDVDHAQVALHRGDLGPVDFRHGDGRAQIRRRREHDPVLTERGHHVLDVPQERRRRTDEEHCSGEVGAFGIEKVRGAVKCHCGLAGAGCALDNRDACAGATDHDVLLRLDRRHHVLHPTGPRSVERRHERTLADEMEPGFARRGDVEHLVLQPDQLAVTPTEVASPHDAHRVVGQGPIERLGRRRAPIDDERIAVFVGDGRTPYVQAAPVGKVETTHEQAVLRDVERREAVARMGDGAVALEQRLRAPALGLPGRAGHALGRAAHGHHPVVRGIEVVPLQAQLVVT